MLIASSQNINEIINWKAKADIIAYHSKEEYYHYRILSGIYAGKEVQRQYTDILKFLLRQMFQMWRLGKDWVRIMI